MRLLPKNWREIAERINAEVNQCTYVADVPDWGRMPTDSKGGDCKNYGMEKFFRLLDAGFPVERLRLAICEIFIHAKQQREQHLVLVIDAPHEQYVLSNSVSRLMTHPDLVLKGWQRKGIQKIDPENPESLTWMRREFGPWEAA